MHRREFLKAAGSGAAVAAIPWGWTAGSAEAATSAPFHHGVASGDPLPDAVVIWTRVTPTPDATPGSGAGPEVMVSWQLATDPSFATVVRSGSVMATVAGDHTVKTDVGGLLPATVYFYRFSMGGSTSPTGRTRTAPANNAALARLRFGLVSCSNWEGGFFSPYRHMAQRNDLDFVLHVGDYIYEYEPGKYGPGRPGAPHVPAREMVSLSDYRQRHAQYKTDPDLQALHARHPWIVTLDDHEVTNDSHRSGAENHQPLTEGDYAERRRRAYQAYLEYMPLRPPDTSDPLRLYRRLQFGTLADLTMLDLRQYRDPQVPPNDTAAVTSPARTILGDAQEAFLHGTLGASQRPQWRLIGNSVVIVPFRIPPNPLGFPPINTDQWDGYAADRQQLIDYIVANNVSNVVFLTGDIHSSWAAELPRDPATYPATGSVAAEFVCTSVTSDNLNEGTGTAPARTSVPIEAGLIANNPWIKLLNFDDHGYSVVEVTPERVQTDWYYIQHSTNPAADPRLDPNATQRFGQAFAVTTGTNRVAPAALPIADDGTGPPPVIPEVPVAALLPGSAVAVLGAAYAVTRFRERAAHPATPE